MTAPAYREFSAGQLPKEKRDEDIEVTVIAGVTSQGTVGAVTDRPTRPLYLDVRLPEAARFRETVAPTHAAFIYVVAGSICVASNQPGAASVVDAGSLAILGEGGAVEVSGKGTANRFLLIACHAIDEPVARGGPFVMNTDDELRQAFSDYQSGKF